jgi:hypothetical protein
MVRAKWTNHKPNWLSWRLGFVNSGFRSQHTRSASDECVMHVSAFDAKLLARHSFSSRPRRVQVSSASVNAVSPGPSQQARHRAVVSKAAHEEQVHFFSALAVLAVQRACRRQLSRGPQPIFLSQTHISGKVEFTIPYRMCSILSAFDKASTHGARFYYSPTTY